MGAAVTEIVGRIERVTFTNAENGYTVARVSVDGSGEPITVVGQFAEASVGSEYRFAGTWSDHPKFGRQFSIESATALSPRSPEAIERFLSGGSVRGIGPATAKRIVAAFGADTLRVMDEEIGRLRTVPGIGSKRLREIRESWKGQRGTRDALIYLQSLGLGGGLSARIVRRLGAGAADAVKANPYRLASEIPGVGFQTADRIALGMGVRHDSEERLAAGTLRTLERFVSDGHCFAERTALEERGAELLGVEAEAVTAAIGRLAGANRVVIDGSAVYTPPLYAAETRAASKLAALARAPARGAAHSEASSIDEAHTLEQAYRGMTVALSERQRQAIAAAVHGTVTVITGGPGTGKTTITNALLAAFDGLHLTTLLAAPTGRAAKRMSESTRREALTIHRLLEIEPLGGRFRKNADSPLDCDALIVDEASMIDLPLFDALLDALVPGVRLVFIGDADQLPSVGPGSVLSDIIESGAVPVVHLTDIYRQSEGSGIIAGAHAILLGEMPVFSTDESGDFFFIEQSDPGRIAELVRVLVAERIPRRLSLSAPTETQVVTPMNRGITGTLELNALLQQTLNPAGAIVTRGARTFRVGDKVMQVRNDYERDVYNGDIGTIVAAGRGGETVDVEFDRGFVRYEPADLDELSLAYAVTVHKSQGGEFPAVVLPLHTQHYLLLQRNLLYTAVTRARRLVVIVGSRKALALALANNRVAERFRRFAQRLAAAVRA